MAIHDNKPSMYLKCMMNLFRILGVFFLYSLTVSPVLEKLGQREDGCVFAHVLWGNRDLLLFICQSLQICSALSVALTICLHQIRNAYVTMASQEIHSHSSREGGREREGGYRSGLSSQVSHDGEIF